MKVAISEDESVILSRSTLVHDDAVFSKAEIRKALRGNKSIISLKCCCNKACTYLRLCRKNKSGTVKAGCTTIPKKTVALIRKWANAK